MSIITCDHNLGLLEKVLWASDFDPLNNGNIFVSPIKPGPASTNSTGTAAQKNKFVRLYKDDKKIHHLLWIPYYINLRYHQ